MSRITTHVLDTARGLPARGVPVTLERADAAGAYALVGRGETDADGRLRTLLPDGEAAPHGRYRITFDTASYLAAQGTAPFFPEVAIVFEVRDDRHHHVPLLLSPFGYSTYRGS